MHEFDLQGIGLVSWDLDGTCYSISRLRGAVIGLLVERTLRERRWRVWQEWRDFRSLQRSLQQAAAHDWGAENTGPTGPRFAAIRERLEARWLEPALGRTGVRPHLVEFLQALRSRQLPQVVFSNFEARGKLRALGLEAYFDAIYPGEQIGFKPNPAGFRQMATDFRVRVQEILHIGDRPDHDAAASRAAGCRCLILGRDFRDFSELADLTFGSSANR